MFIAIELDAAILRAVESVQNRLRGEPAGRFVRWASPLSIHLTLKFLGETPAGRERAVVAALEAACARAPFALVAEGIGCFPNLRRPRIVWVGVGGDMDALSSLRASLEEHVSPLGYPTESRDFHPHLTLGRLHDARPCKASAVGDLVQKTRVGRLGEMRVARVSLMHSDLRPGGAVYTRLADVPLGKQAASGE